MSSMQEALKKAGVKVQEKPQKKKQFVRKKKHTHHFKHRTQCELCRKTYPDVEHYEHNNIRLRALPRVKANPFSKGSTVILA